jgi:hypothetical protein
LDWRGTWRRWWYHLGALTVLVPVVFYGSYMDLQTLTLRAEQEDLRSVAVDVGPWQLQLQELKSAEPYRDPAEGLEKAFWIIPCPRCADEIRAVFVNLKRPGSSAYGALASGNPHRSFAEMKIGRDPSPDDLVWITAEGWNGSLHQAGLPLRRASPVTAEWLEKGAF